MIFLSLNPVVNVCPLAEFDSSCFSFFPLSQFNHLIFKYKIHFIFHWHIWSHQVSFLVDSLYILDTKIQCLKVHPSSMSLLYLFSLCINLYNFKFMFFIRYTIFNVCENSENRIFEGKHKTEKYFSIQSPEVL